MPEHGEEWTLMLGEVQQTLERVLDRPGLDQLAQELGFVPDTLPGRGTTGKIRGLLQAVEGARRIPDLLTLTNRIVSASKDRRISPAVRESLARYAAMSAEELSEAFAPHYTARFEYDVTYTIDGTGCLSIDTHIVPADNLRPLPRIGLQMTVPGTFSMVSWYGRGPHETYVDRKRGAKIGVYGGSVDEQYVPYVTPQENGNKTEVRWLALTDERGVGFLVAAAEADVEGPWLNMSVHHYTTEDLTCARHTYELTRRDDITLNLDYAQSGLGNGSCGAGILEKYLLKPREVRFSMTFAPLTGESTPVQTYKELVQ